MQKWRLLAVLLWAAVLTSTPSPVLALGSPQLTITCIRDAALNYTLINNPKYVGELQRIIDSFGDARPVVFIECAAVDGLYAYQGGGDDEGIPRHSYIVYSPTFVRLATQSDNTKLIFLLGHEYGHISLGHFTDQKDLSIYQKELAADKKGACAVARQNGSLDSLIQILSGLRDATSESGYPSLADSEKAVRDGYTACLSTGQLQDGPALPRSRVALIHPLATTVESVARSIDWLTSRAWDSDLDSIRNLKVRTPEPATQLSIAEIDRLWRQDESLFLVLSDRSATTDASASDVTGPSFSGLFYIGPFAAQTESAVVQLGLAESFTASVTDPARRDLLLTEKIAAVALGFAALKYAMETNQPREIVRRFAQVTDLALRDLRKHSTEVAGFSEWTDNLSQVDELLAGVRS